MKKLFALILALLLCITPILTGCDTSKEPEATESPAGNKPSSPSANAPTGGGATVNTANAAVVIQEINSTDLLKAYNDLILPAEGSQQIMEVVDNIYSGMAILPAVYDIIRDIATADEYGVGMDVTRGDETGSIFAAVKDGLAYTSSLSPDNILTEGYIYLSTTEPVYFDNYDGVWEKRETSPEPAPPVDDFEPDIGVEPLAATIDTDEDEEMQAKIEKLLKDFKVPTISETDLLAKNGKLVITDGYIKNVLRENMALLLYGDASATLTQDEIDEFEAELATMFDDATLEIAVTTAADFISSVTFTFKATDETAEDAGATISIELAAADLIKKVAISADTRIEDGSVYTTSLSMELLYSGKQNTGLRFVLDGYSIDVHNHHMSEQFLISTETFTHTVQKINLDFTFNYANVGTANPKILSLSCEIVPEKQLEVTVTTLTTTYETQTTYTEVAMEPNRQSISAELLYESKTQLSFDMEFISTASSDESIIFDGTVYLGTVVGFPTDIPEIVLDTIAQDTLQ